MNHAAAPGKFGGYECYRLPILTGKSVADFLEKLSKTSNGMFWKICMTIKILK